MPKSVSKRAGQIKTLVHLTVHKLRRDGVGSVFKQCIEALRQRHDSVQGESDFDHEFGTDTGGIVPLWKLDIQSSHQVHGVRYQASDPQFVRTAIDLLQVRPEEFLFVDMGSGKGLTLLIASEYAFRRIIGIEFSPELHAIATENIRKHRRAKRRCDAISSILADAANYEFPTENMILYLYNPFDEKVLRRVIENLGNSLARQDREIYLIYGNPICAQLLDEVDYLERFHVWTDAAVYRHRSSLQ